MAFFNSSFGAVANTLTASYKYKETGSNAWISGNTALNLTINNNNFSFEGYVKGDTNTGFSADKSFDIQIIITDLLSERAITLILAVGEPAIDVYKSNVAFGGIYNEDESEYQAQFKKAVNFYGGIYKNGVEIGGESLPIGSMIPFGSQENIPSNWKICDGSAISRETYAELFNVIGTSYGEGDGSTTFNLPDKRGRVSVGLDSNQTEFDTIGKKSGSKYLQKHKHKLGEEGAWYYGVSSANLSGTGTWAYRAYETNEAGEGDSGNLQPYEIDVWIIKVSNLVSSLENKNANVINNLTSTSATDALSANMGKVLGDRSNYSTQETVIGTWMGKPLYRKVLTGTLPNTGEVKFSIQNAKITDYEGIIQSKWGFWYKINDQFTTEQGYEIYSALNDNRNELSLFCGSFYTTNSQYEITLEYTKTTD